MALTFSQMTQQILAETYRDASFTTAVENAITSAIKELEINQLFINVAEATLDLPIGSDNVELPEDFISVLEMQLIMRLEGATPPSSLPYTIINTAATGFREVTFWELQTYKNYYMAYQTYGGVPYAWALWGNKVYVAPYTQTGYSLRLFYYRRDGFYPPYADPNYISLWMGDFTQDVTRYTARGIFYRDSLQSPELAASDFAKAEDALSKLKARSGQREVINTLSL